MSQSFVEPSLFDLLDEYSGRIASGEVTVGRAAKRSSNVIAFIQSFFEQLFGSCFDLQLEAFDDNSKRLSVELRHERDVRSELRPLITAFEEACDFYPDVIGASYGGGSITTFKRFHKRFLPRMLKSASTWAAATEQAELKERIENSLSVYIAAMKEAKW